VVRGAGLGFLAGVVAGGAIGLVVAHDAAKAGDDLAYFDVPIGMVLGGGAGIVLGGVVGATSGRDRWEPLKLPITIGLFPSAHALRLSVALTN